MPTRRILFSWIGHADLRALAASLPESEQQEVLKGLNPPKPSAGQPGPLKCLLDAEQFDEVHLLSDHPAAKNRLFLKRIGGDAELHPVKRTNPTDYPEVFKVADNELAAVVDVRPALNKVACPDFAGIWSADVYPIRPRPGEVSREFLACLLRSDGFLTYATKHSSRTNIPKINRPALLAFQMKLPPFCDQLRFDAIAQRIREMKHHRLASSKEADSCFDALVQRAFRGGL